MLLYVAFPTTTILDYYSDATFFAGNERDDKNMDANTTARKQIDWNPTNKAALSRKVRACMLFNRHYCFARSPEILVVKQADKYLEDIVKTEFFEGKLPYTEEIDRADKWEAIGKALKTKFRAEGLDEDSPKEKNKEEKKNRKVVYDKRGLRHRYVVQFFL